MVFCYDFLMENKKSLFISKQIRKLTRTEGLYVINIVKIIQNKVDKNIISYIPHYVSYDNKIRPLILDINILLKIENKHGKISIENLLINAHDFDYIIRNVDNNIDKINLIKLIPKTNNFLIISAVRINGFFMLTHFVTEGLIGNELKSLLGRGELLSLDS